MTENTDYVRWFEEVGMDDIPDVGGKNAALGAMIPELREEGIQVPEGFATTSGVYWEVIRENGLDEFITARLDDLQQGRKSCPRSVGPFETESCRRSGLQRSRPPFVRPTSSFAAAMTRKPWMWLSAAAPQPKISLTPALPVSRRPF